MFEFREFTLPKQTSPVHCEWPECNGGAMSFRSARYRVYLCGYPFPALRRIDITRGEPLRVCANCRKKLTTMYDAFAGLDPDTGAESSGGRNKPAREPSPSSQARRPKTRPGRSDSTASVSPSSARELEGVA